MPPSLIAVTGATGAVGSRVAALLAARGVPQRLVVRDPSRAPQLAQAEVRVAAGYHARDELRRAFAGVRTLLLIPAGEAADRVDQHRTAVEAAVAAGVERIVYLSFVDPSPDATFTLVHDHFHTEEAVRASGTAWTFPRMNLYADFLPSMVGPDGVLRGPAGDGRAAVVLRDDVAAACAAVLTSEGHDGQTYDLTGPEAISLQDAAEVMSRLCGRTITYRDETDEEALASRAHFGAPEWEVRGWISSYQAIRSGVLARVSSGVERLTGRAPASLADHLAAHPESLPQL